ncbi:Myosin type-2 heavy chain 1 [Mycoemilia scoparia]|uniref:Myosin type-2 heavy chain 1 n=1 Tax=Mycoemilia scoparia TaxID=417184 RepID=A0A9W8DSE8_9FUNG|nr:Myosin type-2 heavy chain 1 [Mycoemilia scoparia]
MDIPIESSYKKGTLVYIEDKEKAWIRAQVTQVSVRKEENGSGVVNIEAKDIADYNDSAIDSGNGEDKKEVTYIYEATFNELYNTKTKQLPPLCNPPSTDGIDDLINLSYLHEPAVLDNLRLRYRDKEIYTYSGIVLVALNPFARVDRYSQHELETYAGRTRGELQPHLFAIAEDAYQGMVRDNKNQTIIVSGESGAGKTMSARYIMRYFATAHDDSSSHSFGSGFGHNATADMSISNSSGIGSGIERARSIEEQIMATNPVLESFGNAKTTRNDNSSRFGKYLEIHFNDKMAISSASIRTYLLERSRLVFQPKTERNYHIFYQLLAMAASGGGGASSKYNGLGLEDGWKGFHYTRQGGDGCGEIPDVNDATEFERTCEAMSLIGINEKTQSNIFGLLAALLHMGNIEIKGNDRTGAIVDEDDVAFNKAAELLQVDVSEFRKWMTKKQTKTGKDMIISNLNTDQATVVRDSVAKYIYVHLFSWIVHALNESLDSGSDHSEDSPFIGVLDIYGFEHFEINSFEQFCINYANEKLQRHFNRHVFQLEQEEYQREGLENWTFVNFQDNQPCIELIEGKPGVFNILDDVCRSQRTDEEFATMLYQNLAPNDNGQKKPKPKQSLNEKNPTTPDKITPSDFFEKPRFDNRAFTICHYAHKVSYKVDGFIEKNKDTVPNEVQDMLKASKSDLLNKIFEFASEQEEIQKQKATEAASSAISKKTGTPMLVRKTTTSKASSHRKPTLGAEFRMSLIELMKKISSTETHYIRCIKPNENKRAWEFDANMVMAQLRACGVLETIRISCAGYPSRLEIPEFIDAFALLAKQRPTKYEGVEDVRNFARQILKDSIPDDDDGKYQVGHTKVFFRAGMLAYMNNLRTDKREAGAIFIQKMSRMYLARQRFLKQRKMAIRIQLASRTLAAKKVLDNLRHRKSAIILQTAVRGYLARTRYAIMIKSAKRIVSAVEGYMVRKRFVANRKEEAAIKIQSVVRGFLARKKFQRKVWAVIRIQSKLRTRTAKKMFKEKQKDATSAAHFKEVTYKLEGKVVELTQRLGNSQQSCQVLENENKTLKEKQTELEFRLSEVEFQAESQDKLSKERIASLVEENGNIRSENLDISKKFEDLSKDFEAQKIESAENTKKEKERADKLEKMLTELTEQIDAIKEEREVLKNKITMLEQQNAASGAGTGAAAASAAAAVAATNGGMLLNGGQKNQFSMPSAVVRKASQRNLNSTADLSGYVYADSSANNSATPASSNSINIPTTPNGKSLAGMPNGAPSNNSNTNYRQSRHFDGNQNPSLYSTNGQGLQYNANPQQAHPHHHHQAYEYDPSTFNSNNGGSSNGGPNGLLPSPPPPPPAPGTGYYTLTETQVCDLLRYDDGLLDEILYDLIDQIQIPDFNPQSPLPQAHIHFPAHIIGLCAIKMIQYNLANRINELITSLVARIKKYTDKFVSDNTTLFWMSNIFELLSIIKTSISQNESAGEAFKESMWVLSQAMSYLEAFLSDIYFGWARKLMKDISGYVVPALIEHQELNDYKETESFFSKMMGGGNSSRASDIMLSHLTRFLTEIWDVMKFYYIDLNITKQVMSEILSEVGAIAFNNLINRRHFCSSYRGMQIQFNVSKIDEWCKAYDVFDNAGNLDRLLQAAKILQMNKITEDDIRIIIEVSDSLNIAQIKRLLRNYKPADGEPTVPSRLMHHELLKMDNDPIMIDNNLLGEQILYLTARKVPAIETYTPEYLSISRLRSIIQSQSCEDGVDYYYDENGDVVADYMDSYDSAPPQHGGGGGGGPGNIGSNGGGSSNSSGGPQQFNTPNSLSNNSSATATNNINNENGGAGRTPIDVEATQSQKAYTGLGLDTPTLTREYEYHHKG